MLTKVAKIFDVDRAMMSCFWQEICNKMQAQGSTIDDVMPDIGFLQNEVANSGGHKKYNRKELKEALKCLPLKQRQNYRVLALSLGVPKTTLMQIVHKEWVMWRHSSSLKPALDEEKR